MTKRLLFLSFLLLLTSVFVYMHLSQKKQQTLTTLFPIQKKRRQIFIERITM